MKKSDNTMMYVAGAGVLALLVMSKSSAATVATPTSNAYGVIPVTPPASSAVPTGGATTIPLSDICPGLVGNNTMVPVPPAVYNTAYFMQYQYPALTAHNPNLLNSNYQLTLGELAQYAANYVAVAQGVKTWTSNGGNYNLNLQSHWKQYGVAGHYVFDPFLPTVTAPYVPPAATSSKTSSSTGSTILSVATGLISLLGIGSPIPELTDLDLETVAEGYAVMKDLLPMFYGADSRAADIDQDFIDTLGYYLA